VFDFQLSSARGRCGAPPAGGAGEGDARPASHRAQPRAERSCAAVSRALLHGCTAPRPPPPPSLLAPWVSHCGSVLGRPLHGYTEGLQSWCCVTLNQGKLRPRGQGQHQASPASHGPWPPRTRVSSRRDTGWAATRAEWPQRAQGAEHPRSGTRVLVHPQPVVSSYARSVVVQVLGH
jgi:hypothetical protein